jgi:hypothetical protein
LGLAALFVEGVVVAVAAYAVSLRRSASLEALGMSSGTDAGPNDVAYTSPAISNVNLRRSPVVERSAG